MIGRIAPQHESLTLSFLKLPLALVCERLTTMLPEIEDAVFKKNDGFYYLRDCFIGVPPAGAAHKVRLLALSPAPRKFVLFTANLEDGWSSVAYKLSKEFNTNALILRLSTGDVSCPARSFTWTKGLDVIRHVAVRLEDKWSFFQEGASLSQEDVRPYENRLISSRLTNENLITLAQSLGFPIELESELSGTGTLFVQS